MRQTRRYVGCGAGGAGRVGGPAFSTCSTTTAAGVRGSIRRSGPRPPTPCCCSATSASPRRRHECGGARRGGGGGGGAASAAARRPPRSSFNTRVSAIEGFREYERAGGPARPPTAARRGGEEY